MEKTEVFLLIWKTGREKGVKRKGSSGMRTT
jgi:hypothetical protein